MSSPEDLSYSLFLERISTNNEPQKRKDNGINIARIKPTKIQSWVRDDSVVCCSKCGIKFSLMVRRHHCRACGRIFCDSCTPKYITLPQNIEFFPRAPKNKFYSFSSLFSSSTTPKEKERVCKSCEKQYRDLSQNITKIVQILNIINLDLEEIYTLSSISREWNKATNIIKSSFRDIQYKLPTSETTIRERNLIKTNSRFFSGHSRWISQLIKTTDLTNDDCIDETISIIKQKKHVSCWSLMCTRFCKPSIGYEEALELLYCGITNKKIRRVLVDCFRDTNEEILESLVPFFCFDLKNDCYNESIMLDFLIEISVKNEKIRNSVYWSMISLKNRDENDEFDYFYKKFMFSLNEYCGREIVWNQLIKTRRILKIFNQIPITSSKSKTVDFLKNKLEKYNLQDSRTDECFMFQDDDDQDENSIKISFQLPFDPTFWVEKIDLENIHIKNSATMPIVIPLVCKNIITGEIVTKEIMHKPEDLTKDMIVMNIIKVMDFILKREENLNLNIITYNVLSTSSSSGLIEMVRESETIYSIIQRKKFTVQNFILENNPSQTVEQIRDGFVKSCAAYCVISYLLAVGDRHLDNIMISREGFLFHIDYGFIMGFDPKPMSPYMRITQDMIDVMGGENSLHYSKFKKYCTRAYNCLRGYTNLFSNMLLFLTEEGLGIDNCKFTKARLESEITNRFAPGANHVEAKLQLFNRMNTNSMTDQFFIDFFHYHSRDSYLSGAIKNISDYFKEIKFGFF